MSFNTISTQISICWKVINGTKNHSTLSSHTSTPSSHNFLKSSINRVRYTSISFHDCLGPAIIIQSIMYFRLMHNQLGRLQIISKTGHELWLVLKLQKGFILSEARPSLRFLGSSEKSRYKRSIVSHCGESTGC